MIDKNISYDVKKVDNDEWNKILAQFDDSNIYQTAMFNRLSTGGKNLEQFTIKLENEVVSACLLRIKTVPLVNRGIAFLRWGPIFRKKKSEIDLNIFSITLNKLKEEYCIKR